MDFWRASSVEEKAATALASGMLQAAVEKVLKALNAVTMAEVAKKGKVQIIGLAP